MDLAGLFGPCLAPLYAGGSCTKPWSSDAFGHGSVLGSSVSQGKALWIVQDRLDKHGVIDDSTIGAVVSLANQDLSDPELQVT